MAAYNTRPVFLWIKAHPKSSQNVGYVISIDGVNVYHAGDTDYIPEMDMISDIDVALVPIGGDNLTMNVGDAAKTLDKIKPKIAVPMHYEIKKQGGLKELENLVQGETAIKVMQ